MISRTMQRNKLIVANARLVLPQTEFKAGNLHCENGLITAIEPTTTIFNKDSMCHDAEYIDATGDIIIPGLIDLHVHGCDGADVMDNNPHALEKMAAGLLHQGTTAFLATTMTAAKAKTDRILTAAMQNPPWIGLAELLGFHLEGPCISAQYRGAQKVNTSEITAVPTTEQVKIITLAPELPEAAAYFNLARQKNILLAAGHSAASYEQMQQAVEKGLHYVTHAFNAMPGIHHRAPGLLTAALLDSRVTIELIADGVHIHPAVLELAIRLKGADGIVLVSDGTRAVGLPDGEYELGGQMAKLSQGRMTLADGTIAGSAQPLLAGIRLLVRSLDRPLFEFVRMATLSPARVLGVANRLGSLEIGKEATFLRLSHEYELKQVWQKGQLCYDTVK